LFELINLIQIRKRRRNFADFFCRIHILSATLLICSQAEKIRDIMSLMAVFTREWVSPTDLSCFTDSFIQVLCRFSGTTYDVITFLICIIQKHEYLYNE